MKLGKGLLPLFFLVVNGILLAQDLPLNYTLGENYSDRYKYSTVLSLNTDDSGRTVMVRTYYGGMPLRPKGHFIEVYDESMVLEQDYNYKYAGKHMVDAFVRNGQLYLLELRYNTDQQAYDYIVHQSPLTDFNFNERTLLSIPSKEVINPLAVNKYNRNFGNGFSTTTYFNDSRTAFAISVHHRERKDEKYHIYLFGTDLKKHLEYDFSDQIIDKNYAFENLAVSKDLKTIYLMGKAYFKKRRFNAKERRFQYELVQVTNSGHRSQDFNEPGRFPEALKPILHEGDLLAVGFYADRKDKRYNGLAYFKLNANDLSIMTKKYNAFSSQFMMDKFGREVDAEIKNLIFKDVHINDNKDILFSAEEYFVTDGTDIGDSSTKKVRNYHYNDIVCAKLNAQGEMLWARNINKTEVTRGDEAYASYSVLGMGNDQYFFINSGEHPQKLGRNRIVFKQGYSKNPNMFVIRLNGKGEMDYQKLIDDKEVRLPIMVSKPLIDKKAGQLLFYAKRGSKKQLVRVFFDAVKKTSDSK